VTIDKSEHRRVLELLDAVTAARDRAEAERDAMKCWRDLGILTVAIATGEALRSAAVASDDNPVNCISAIMNERDRLRQVNAALVRDLNSALARLASLEAAVTRHRCPGNARAECALHSIISPAPSRGDSVKSLEGSAEKSQARHNAEAGEKLPK